MTSFAFPPASRAHSTLCAKPFRLYSNKPPRSSNIWRSSPFPPLPRRIHENMDWVSTRDEDADTLLNDFPARPSAQSTDFSPLVSGFLSSGTSPAVAGEWSMPHATRNVRNDFRYEFSLSTGPDFDTVSADADDCNQPDDDDISMDGNQATSTSDDTSLGVDVAGGTTKDHFVAHGDVSAPRQSPALSPVPVDANVGHTSNDDVRRFKSQDGEVVILSGGEFARAGEGKSASVSKPSLSQKPKKLIQKKNSTLASKNLTGKGSPTQNNTASLSGGTLITQNGAPSHTKMCRDRLNNMFEQLRHTLPPAPAGVEVKHKAQVLDYAIAVLKSMVDRTSQLEVELAVSSNKATMDWISKLVNRVDSFPEAAKEVMKLFSKRRGWRHAELWTAGRKKSGSDADPEESTVLSFCTSVARDSSMNDTVSLEQFSKESGPYVFNAMEGVQGRVWSSMRPEWVTGLTDEKKFRRASLAGRYGVKVCLAVPVTITGKIEAVMCFYDVKHRPYDVQCLELAMRLAWALGNAVGGKRAKMNVLSSSGTSSN